MEKEIWSPVMGYEGLYEISTIGRIKRLSRVIVDSLGRTKLLKEKILNPHISRQTGYLCVNLSKDGIVKTKNIHQLIADAFIPNPNNLPCINHKDEVRSNSVLSNLERCDYSYNNSYGNAKIKRKESLRKNHEGQHKIIYQFSLDGKLIAIHTCGVSQLEEKLGYYIGDCLLGKSKTAHNYYFSYSNCFSYKEDLPLKHQKYVIKLDGNGKEIERYKSVSEAARKNHIDRHLFSSKQKEGYAEINGMKFIIELKENEYIPKGHKGPRPDLKGRNAKAVSQYTKDGVYLRDFESATQAAEFMGKKFCSDIVNCCKGNLKSAYGFIWTYKGEKAPYSFRNSSMREIEQYSFDGTFIAKYDSIIDAIKAIGKGTPTCIGNNLAGRTHSAYGYIWKYKNK